MVDAEGCVICNAQEEDVCCSLDTNLNFKVYQTNKASNTFRSLGKQGAVLCRGAASGIPTPAVAAA